MSKHRNPYPPEFRAQIVELVKAGPGRHRCLIPWIQTFTPNSYGVRALHLCQALHLWRMQCVLRVSGPRGASAVCHCSGSNSACWLAHHHR